LLVAWNASEHTKLTTKAAPPPSTHLRFGSGSGTDSGMGTGQRMFPSVLHGKGHVRAAGNARKSVGAMRSQRIAVDPMGG
jgi:hypothetical protein